MSQVSILQVPSLQHLPSWLSRPYARTNGRLKKKPYPKRKAQDLTGGAGEREHERGEIVGADGWLMVLPGRRLRRSCALIGLDATPNGHWANRMF